MKLSQRKQFILASASPRRKHLLAEAGFVFDVIPSEIDESLFAAEGAESVGYVKQLALAKAMDVACRYPSMFVLGADTVVDSDGQIIGKPADAADAERIIRLLFSAPHRVITGIALVGINADTEIVEAAVTTVYPVQLTDTQIADHIKSGNWQGKAGAYGIQETGDEFVERIEGSFTNVMGMPMELVVKILKQVAV